MRISDIISLLGTLAALLAPGAALGENPSAINLLKAHVEAGKNRTSRGAGTGSEVSSGLASSSVTGRGGKMVIDNFSVRFLTRHVHRGVKFLPAVIKESLFTRTNEGAEGQISALRMELFPAGDFKSAQTVDVEADSATYEDNYWSCVKEGCCGADTYGRLYCYDSTKPILQYTTEFSSVDIPNSPLSRYFGYLWNEPRASKDQFTSSPHAIGALIYARAEGTSDRIFIVDKQGKKRNSEELLVSTLHFLPQDKRDELSENGRKITLWSSDKAKSPSQVNGPKFEISFAEGDADTSETLTARIREDHIQDVEFKSIELKAVVVRE